MRILNLTSRFSCECRLLLVKQFPLVTRHRSCWLGPTLSFPSSLENASQKMTGICLPALVAANTPGLFKSREQMNPMCMCRSSASQKQNARMLAKHAQKSWPPSQQPPGCPNVAAFLSVWVLLGASLEPCPAYHLPVLKHRFQESLAQMLSSASWWFPSQVKKKSLDELLTLRDGDVKRIVYYLCLTSVSKFSAAKD